MRTAQTLTPPLHHPAQPQDHKQALLRLPAVLQPLCASSFISAPQALPLLNALPHLRRRLLDP